MSHIKISRRKPAASAVATLAFLLACLLVLAACGSSSKSSSTSTSTSTSASATTPAGTGTTGTGPARAGAARFKALRECLQKNGVALPQRTPGQHRPGGPGGAGGSPAAPTPAVRNYRAE